jgi:hypothetical protein
MAWHNKFSGGIFSHLAKTVTVTALIGSALVAGCGGSKAADPIVKPDPKVAGCTGSYIGYASPPSQDVRRAVRDRSLIAKGIDISNLTEEQKNALTGGGGLDGGMYLEGNFAFETDANCNVVKGDFVIFGYPFGISGTVNQDRTFTLSYLGPIVGQVNADNSISGQLQHGGGEEYIHGVLSGTFTPGGKI